MSTMSNAQVHAHLTSAIEALAQVAAAFAPEEQASTAPVRKARTRKAPAKPAADACTCTPEKRCSVCFVLWLKTSAPQRAARKASNAEMAAWMRSKGLTPNGAAWEAVKHGERSVVALRKLV